VAPTADPTAIVLPAAVAATGSRAIAVVTARTNPAVATARTSRAVATARTSRAVATARMEDRVPARIGAPTRAGCRSASTRAGSAS
jgi:hypothetical protein